MKQLILGFLTISMASAAQVGLAAVNPLKSISFEVPKTWSCPTMDREGAVKAIWLEGEPYQGRPTRVFAYYALPEGASPSQKVPAMVLAHGGSGTAYDTWVRTWAARGYAAIAVDTCGCLPVRAPDGKGWLPSGVGGPMGWGGFDQLDAPTTDQWAYQAVAAVIRSHSYLRSLPEVDASRVGLTGISWGGFLAMLTAVTDTRFVFVAPVYTAAFFDQMPAWEKEIAADPRWMKLWDPSNFVSGLTMPAIWAASTNDKAFPFDQLQATFPLLPRAPTMAIRKKMAHSHGPAGENVPEIFEMARFYLRGGNPLPEVGRLEVAEGRLKLAFDLKGRMLKRIEVIWATDDKPNYETEWRTEEYSAVGVEGEFSAPIPSGARRVFVNLILDGATNEGLYREMLVSSQAVEI